MAKADPNARWYRDQLARGRAARAQRAIAMGRPPGRPGSMPAESRLRDDPEVWRAYHAEAERRRYWRIRYGRLDAPAKGTERAGRKLTRTPRRVRRSEPDAPLLAGHELYDEARRVLKGWEANELGSDFDAIAQDLVQDYVTAVLAGEDPLCAVAARRRRYGQDRAVLIHGLARVDDLIR